MPEIVRVHRALYPVNAPWYVRDRQLGRRELVQPTAAQIRQLGEALRGWWHATYGPTGWKLGERAHLGE